jgi:hypothetical protein
MVYYLPEQTLEGKNMAEMQFPLVGLRIHPDLVRAMKIRALQEDRRLQDITSQLWCEYLGIESPDQAIPKSTNSKAKEEQEIKSYGKQHSSRK